MRLLILTGRFARPGDDPWLVDDLVQELVARGVEVDVVVGDVHRPRGRGWGDGATGRSLRAFSVGPTTIVRGPIHKLLLYGLTGLRFRRASRALAKANAYDACVFFTIALTNARAAAVARDQGESRPVVALVLWDFFPIHQAEIGRLRKGPLIPILRRLELWAYGSPDVAMVMSQRNEEFLRRYHSYEGEVRQLRPWIADSVATVPESKFARFTVVFGGQLVRGRGVDVLLRAAALLQHGDRVSEIDVIIAGDGDGAAGLRRLAADLELANVAFLGHVAREEYAVLLARAHAGIAITVSGVSIPSFPSKIGDYCRAGRPVIVASEESSDVGRIVESAGAGVSVEAGKPIDLAVAIERLHRCWMDGKLGDMERSARQFFERELSAEAASRILIDTVSEVQAKRLN